MSYEPGLIALSIFMIIWISGIFIAKGFLQIIAAMFIPPFAWYLVADYILTMSGVA